MDTYSDGNIKTIIEYVNPYDTSDFKLIGFYNSGDTNLVISVSQDMRNGISTYFYENGTMKYRISYKNDQLHGKVTYWYPNGQLWQKAYFNYGQIDDTICDYYESGIIKSIGLFNNGTGEFKYYHPNGRLWKTGKVLNGKEEGNWFYYYSNGIKSGENVYKNGKRIGEYKAFYNTGELMEVGIYDSNLIVQNTFYYKNGEINFEMTNLAQRSRNLVLWTDEQKETLISDCIIEKLKENKYRGDDYCYCIVDKIELLRSYTDYLKETDQERREMMQLIDRLCEYE
ncbi:MAG: hypothetical protein A2X09_12520 [Bacteroidetes bacterium GWF2_43_11]|nr:MAG: hypothetical protein A2X09_12520 [Bacteroidetes bacterium GWF2_43_11]